MKPTTFATKRLWIKRFRKVGHFLFAPFNKVIDITLRFINCFIASPIETFLTSLLFGMVALLIGLFPYSVYMEGYASPGNIAKARQHDACADNTIVKRAANQTKPLSRSDLEKAIDDCNDYWIAKELKESQATALK